MKDIEWIDVRPFIMNEQQGNHNPQRDSEFLDWLIAICPAIWVKIDPKRVPSTYYKVQREAELDPWFLVSTWSSAGQHPSNHIYFSKIGSSGKYRSGGTLQLPIEFTDRIVALKEYPHPKDYIVELPEEVKSIGANI